MLTTPSRPPPGSASAGLALAATTSSSSSGHKINGYLPTSPPPPHLAPPDQSAARSYPPPGGSTELRSRLEQAILRSSNEGTPDIDVVTDPQQQQERVMLSVHRLQQAFPQSHLSGAQHPLPQPHLSSMQPHPQPHLSSTQPHPQPHLSGTQHPHPQPHLSSTQFPFPQSHLSSAQHPLPLSSTQPHPHLSSTQQSLPQPHLSSTQQSLPQPHLSSTHQSLPQPHLSSTQQSLPQPHLSSTQQRSQQPLHVPSGSQRWQQHVPAPSNQRSLLLESSHSNAGVPLSGRDTPSAGLLLAPHSSIHLQRSHPGVASTPPQLMTNGSPHPLHQASAPLLMSHQHQPATRPSTVSMSMATSQLQPIHIPLYSNLSGAEHDPRLRHSGRRDRGVNASAQQQQQHQQRRRSDAGSRLQGQLAPIDTSHSQGVQNNASTTTPPAAPPPDPGGGEQVDVKPQLYHLSLLTVLSLILSIFSVHLLFTNDWAAVTRSDHELRREESTSPQPLLPLVTFTLLALCVVLDLLCLLVCAMQLSYCVRILLQRPPAGTWHLPGNADSRTEALEFLSSCSAYRFLSITGFYLSIPILLAGVVLHLLSPPVPRSAAPPGTPWHPGAPVLVVTGVLGGAGVALLLIAFVHTTYLWYRRHHTQHGESGAPATTHQGSGATTHQAAAGSNKRKRKRGRKNWTKPSTGEGSSWAPARGNTGPAETQGGSQELSTLV